MLEIITAWQKNEVGQAVSTSSYNLEVLYPPSSELRIEPAGPVSEEDNVNVTLHCDVVEGNPLELTRVSWFLNGDLIRELPDPQCHELIGVEYEEMVTEELLVNEGDSASLCDVDPTELMLHEVSRELQGNYTCVGSNIAGEGGSSEPEELIVHYLPGEAVLLQNEEYPMKGSSTIMTCLVEERGNPEAREFLWMQGETILEEKSENLTLNELGLASQENISCSAVNDIGSGESDTIQLEVFAPPNFIENLPEEKSFLSNDENLSLMCQAECFPLCTISWLKNDEIITDGEAFSIEESVIPEDFDTNTFPSVLSRLSWNLKNLPDNKLDHNELNFTISCQVDENDIGLAISSTSHITVEYAPENVEISASFLEVEEGEVVEPILCSADASPEASFVWKFGDEIVSEDSLLEF
eukprot:TRINITY_DN5634_c0_g1_i1.p1 TRINITY_DN5634_c0_g1~~TRINITY_DN5634_c0_g1_i1.p1  ORF type:complete len:412 (+),score=117.82 TRINITY_DN5634_c0_g1_i1:763-1998(+)